MEDHGSVPVAKAGQREILQNLEDALIDGGDDEMLWTTARGSFTWRTVERERERKELPKEKSMIVAMVSTGLCAVVGTAIGAALLGPIGGVVGTAIGAGFGAIIVAALGNNRLRPLIGEA
ncbi:MAG TPA: hypothetical protein VH020_10490 [Stellaceae bacterium]|jgi:hypothetical protein|nr:hypothetical protein [Stellaceae bacterium]